MEFDSGVFKYSNSSELGSPVASGGTEGPVLFLMVNFGNSKLTIRLKLDISVSSIESITSRIFNIWKKKKKKTVAFFTLCTHRLHACPK